VQEDSVTMSGSGVLVMGVQEPASTGLNPLPITVTTVVTGPNVGITEIAAVEALTMNVAEAKSKVVPVTLIVWAPNAAVPETVNDPVIKPPLENVHDPNVTMSGSGVLLIQG
jgi:hypothetical protein